MTTLLTYALLEDLPPFPEQALNPLAYKLEPFASPDEALHKARYILSHSKVHHLALWELNEAMDDAAVRQWIAEHPAHDLGPASEAHGVSQPPTVRAVE